MIYLRLFFEFFKTGLFAVGGGVITYLYFYNLIISIIYGLVAVSAVPYINYLRCKRLYSEFVFEQVQVYTTNVIMEFATTQSFVKSLEGVYSSGVLEDPVKADVKVMIDMAYENGTINQSLEYMNEKYDYYMVRNMHQLFLQITNEGSKDASESLENMSLDIDMLVENLNRMKSYIDNADGDKTWNTVWEGDEVLVVETANPPYVGYEFTCTDKETGKFVCEDANATELLGKSVTISGKDHQNFNSLSGKSAYFIWTNSSGDVYYKEITNATGMTIATSGGAITFTHTSGSIQYLDITLSGSASTFLVLS